MSEMHDQNRTAAPQAAATPLRDRLDRPVRDLRVSVTDRCNFRCTYCMPKETFGPGYRFLPRRELLSYEEIRRVVAAFADLGVRKVRLTGGEPLVRSDLETLIGYVREVPGIDDLSMTTNASLLTRERAEALRAAGLGRLNVSLDALDDETFMRVNDVGVPVRRVLEGIDNAAAAGFAPIKVNMVVRKGINEHQILPMARFFHGTGCILRFIEFMDVGNSNHWDLSEVYPAGRIAADIDAELPIEPISANYRGEVARRWRYRDGGGEVGIIASVTEPFCRDCSRARLSAIGQVYTCLFAGRGHDLRGLLRDGVDDDGLRQRVREIWSARGDRYSELRGRVPGAKVKVEMSYIGG